MSRNPYVGARSFEERDAALLFARDKEKQELRDRLVGRRIVLLHSPSGAGKTSLIRAGLIPLLKEQKLFHIHPIIRVNTPLPAEVLGQGTNCNRYVLSTLLSLENAVATQEQSALVDLATRRLSDYLDHLESFFPRGRHLLIFDQFEELLTSDVTDPDAKMEFCAQLGEGLSVPGRWALFSMRQDYVAALDRYLGPVPYHFEERFALEFLGLDAALLAVRGPAAQEGVEFTQKAARTLIEDLSKVLVQQPDGTMKKQTGSYIEPIFLQVVCRKVWESPRKDPNKISETDVPHVGNVDDALSSYFDESVEKVVKETGVREWHIRDWFGRQLITEQGVRGLVLRGSEQNLGVTNQVVTALKNTYLVREENRSGASWYELAHDRWINPIRQANEARRQARREVRKQALASLPTKVPSPDPYPGPRPFEKDEKLFGRDPEALDLIELLDSHRVVLFYGPAGAGKTSLLQALIVPLLHQDDQRLLAVNGFTFMDSEIRHRATKPNVSPAGWNKYTFSLLLQLEEQTVGPSRGRMVPKIEQLDLGGYLVQRRMTDPLGGAEVLIFDDFEQLVTTDPFDQNDKSQFVDQLAAALADENRRAIFCFDERYLPDLEYYLSRLPIQSGSNYRLSHLSPEGAAEAIRQPARHAGVTFTDEAVNRLVSNLRRIRVQRSDGTLQELLGPTVGAMQLQIACSRVWSQRKPGATKITEKDLEALGDIDDTLAAYYADKVARAALKSGVSERLIRNWFDSQLITPPGIRGQVLHEPDASGGLDNRAITLLVDSILVRAVLRRGLTWYELAHDRLIAPVREDNARWREAHSPPLEQQAQLWAQQGRPSTLLLRGRALREANLWAEQHGHELLKSEHEFLESSRKTDMIEGQAKRRLQWVFAMIGLLAIISSIAVFATQDAYSATSIQRDLAVAAQDTAVANQEHAELARATAEAATNELSLLAGNLSNKVAELSNENATYEVVVLALTGTPTPVATGTATSTPAFLTPFPSIGTSTPPPPSATALAGFYPQAHFEEIPATKYEKGRRDRTILAIVNRRPAATMEQVIAHFADERLPPSSSHYAVGIDGSVVQFVNDHDTAFHAGALFQPDLKLVPWLNEATLAGVGANSVTLVIYWIDREHSSTTSPFDESWMPTERQYLAGANLIYYMVRTYNIPADRMHINFASDLDSSKSWNPGKGFPIDPLLTYIQELP